MYKVLTVMTHSIFADDINLTISIKRNNIKNIYYKMYCPLGWNNHSKKISSEMATNVSIMNRVKHL